MTHYRRRILAVVRHITDCIEWDAWIPHGSAEWRAVRALVAAGYLRSVGPAMCCDSVRHRAEPTEVEGFVLTAAGRAVLEEG